MSSNYSIDTILAELIRVSQNSIEIISKLSDATTTQDSQVTVKMTMTDGTIKEFSYPSLGHLKNELARIDREIQRLLGITDDGSISVKLADGTYSSIFLEKFSVEPAKMSGLPVPTNFSKQNNWFFEQFLNPLLYVSFDVQNKVDDKAERALIKRLILILDTQEKLDYFSAEILGKNNLEYNTTLKNLSARGVGFFVDEDTIPLPVSIVRYVGSFDVSNIVDEPTTTLIDGAEVKTSKRKYFLSKLTYTDNNEPVKDNKFLQVGDVLIRKENTKYRITELSNSEKYVVLERLAGNSAIGIGANQLTIDPGRFADKQVRVNVGFDERQIIWIRAIDPNFEVAATEWGDGVGLYSNTLTIETTSGNVSLEDFYLNEVSDFGKIFLSAAKEKPIPAVDGLIPNAPTLTAESFKVVRVDAHKDESQAIDDIKAKQAERLKVSSEIEKLNTSIINKTKELNTTKFASDAQRLSVQTELTNLIAQKSSKSTYYSSLVTDLVAKGKALGGGLSKPKYAVRGFFPLPDSKKGSTGTQQIVQFIKSYRYLRKDGSASNAQQSQFVSNEGTLQQAVYSDWTEVYGPVRKREYDSTTGRYEWVTDDPASADIVNINQISIPISSGEQVEFRVRSVSEAGWPSNPLFSPWSESIIQDFDDTLPVGNETTFIINDANAEDIRLKFQNDLTAIDQHISGSFNSGEKYYAHPLADISSGFFDSNQQVINAYQKLKEHDDAIAALNQTISATSAGIQISVIDPTSGTKTIVNSGQTLELDAGYYTDQVDVSNPANWGSILTKVWNLTVENTSSSALELVSIFNSDVLIPLLEVSDLQADRYKNVPFVVGNIKDGDEKYIDAGANLYSFINPAGYQSAQVVNQWIYTRQRNLTGTELYDTSTNNLNLPIIDAGASGSTDIVRVSNATNFANPLAAPGSWVHQQLTALGVTDEYTYIDLYEFWNTLYRYQGQTNVIGNTIQINKSYPAEVISNFRDSSNSKLNSFYKNQIPKVNQLLTAFDYTKFSPMKGSFFTNDKYLVGSNSCLDYFFLAPDSYQTVQVPGTFSFSSKKVNNGESNAIKIPLIYQFRMIDRKSTILGGSDQPTNRRNLTWSKTIGVDIFYKDAGKTEVFSFDVKVNSNYRKIKQA